MHLSVHVLYHLDLSIHNREGSLNLFGSRHVSTYNGHMTGITQTREGVIDWDAIEADYIDRPGLTLKELAVENDVRYKTLERRAAPDRGNWIAKRKDKFRALREQNARRMADILHQDQRDKVKTFQALESRLECVVLSSLELLFPPEDAPPEVHLAAKRRLELMSAKQLSTMISEGMRTLTETGRHRRLLSGQATAIFARAETPDVLLDIPIEQARALEIKTRMAQTVMNSLENGEPLDVDFAVIDALEGPPEEVRPSSPKFARGRDSAGSPIPVGVSSDGPAVRRHRS